MTACFVCGQLRCLCATEPDQYPNNTPITGRLRQHLIQTVETANHANLTLTDMVLTGVEPGFIESDLIRATADLRRLQATVTRTLNALTAQTGRAREKDDRALGLTNNVTPIRRAA